MIVVVVTHETEDAVELNQPKSARHLRFDVDITGNAMVVNTFWECNEHLKDEIPLE